MPIPPSNSIRVNHIVVDVTSIESILEGVGIKDAESMTSTYSEAPLVLVEPNEQDLFFVAYCYGNHWLHRLYNLVFRHYYITIT